MYEVRKQGKTWGIFAQDGSLLEGGFFERSAADASLRKHNLEEVDAALDGTCDQLLTFETELRAAAFGRPTEENIRLGGAISALSRARRAIQEAQYFLTKED